MSTTTNATNAGACAEGIYLASPYSNPDPAVREFRFREACRAAAALMQSGRWVFSPIAHGHPICEHGVPSDWTQWQELDRQMLRQCDELVVLTFDGWRGSCGVQAEIRLAVELGKPIRYVSPEDPAGGPASNTTQQQMSSDAFPDLVCPTSSV